MFNKYKNKASQSWKKYVAKKAIGKVKMKIAYQQKKPSETLEMQRQKPFFPQNLGGTASFWPSCGSHPPNPTVSHHPPAQSAPHSGGA